MLQITEEVTGSVQLSMDDIRDAVGVYMSSIGKELPLDTELFFSKGNKQVFIDTLVVRYNERAEYLGSYAPRDRK